MWGCLLPSTGILVLEKMFGRFWFLHSKFVLVYVFLLFFEENTFVLCLNTSHMNDNFEPIKNSVKGY